MSPTSSGRGRSTSGRSGSKSCSNARATSASGGGGGFHIGFEEGDAAQIGSTGIEIVIRVDDVDEAYDRSRAAGVVFDSAPEDQPWGARHAWLHDPDGYPLSICSPVVTA